MFVPLIAKQQPRLGIATRPPLIARCPASAAAPLKSRAPSSPRGDRSHTHGQTGRPLGPFQKIAKLNFCRAEGAGRAPGNGECEGREAGRP